MPKRHIETPFYPVGTFSVRDVRWYLADSDLVTINDTEYVKACERTRFDLPIEFFQHQLLELDPYDKDALIAFMGEYGIPKHPTRDGAKYSVSASPDEFNMALLHSNEAAFHELDGFENVVTFAQAYVLHNEPDIGFGTTYADRVTSALVRLIGGEELTVDIDGKEYSAQFDLEIELSEFTELINGSDLTSLDEARISILDLQADIRCMLAYMKHDAKEWAEVITDYPSIERLYGNLDGWQAFFINSGNRARNAIVTKQRPQFSANLTDAICAQVIDFMTVDAADTTGVPGTPFRICERCGRVFRRFQPRGKSVYQKSRSNIYCCQRCQDAQKQADKRKRDRDRAGADTAKKDI